MKRSLVRFLLAILICVSSLQGVAAELLACCATAPAGSHHSGAQHETGQHHHAARSAHSAHSTRATGHQHAAQSCASCLACCTAPAALPAAMPALASCQSEALFQPVLPAPPGHIPDTPERPPRYHGA